jgi:hypothetical protein
LIALSDAPTLPAKLNAGCSDEIPKDPLGLTVTVMPDKVGTRTGAAETADMPISRRNKELVLLTTGGNRQS